MISKGKIIFICLVCFVFLNQNLSFSQTPNNYKLTIVSGDGQKVALKGIMKFGGMAKFAPLKVRLTDSKGFGVGTKALKVLAVGRPPMEVRVRPWNSSSSTNYSLSFIDDHTVFTDAKGFAIVDDIERHSILCHSGTGDLKVTVDLLVGRASDPRANKVTFKLKVLPKKKRRNIRKKKKRKSP